jgi:hypothetical protein
MKKTQLIKDGYDISNTQPDKVYFWRNGKYEPLTTSLYQSVQVGELNL